MGERGLPLTVLHQAATSVMRIRASSPEIRCYAARILSNDEFEKIPECSKARSVWRQMAGVNPEVVVLGGYSDGGVWAAWLWGLTHGVPMVLWAETNVFDRPRVFWKESLKRLFIAGCNGAHVYGRTAREYVAALGMPQDRIFTKRAVVDTALFGSAESISCRNVPRDYVRGLYVGRFSPEKNIERLIRVIARANATGGGRRLRLALVGFGPQEKAVSEWIGTYGVGDVVDVLGPKTQEGVRDECALSDFLVLPSLREPYGLVVLEAMVAGLPVAVSARCGCVADVVTQRTGWCFDPNDDDAMAAVFGEIKRMSPSALRAMGRAARELAKEYGPGECADRVIGNLALRAAKR